MSKSTTIDVSIPESWKELPLRLRLLYMRKRSEIGHMASAILLAREINSKAMVAIEKLDDSEEVVAQIVDRLSYLQTPPAFAIIPSFNHGGVDYHFGEAHLDNSSYIEYMLADKYYAEMVEHHDSGDHQAAFHSACCMVFALARPIDESRSEQDDQREIIISAKQIERRAEAVPKHIIEVAALYYESAATKVREVFGPYLFGGDSDGSGQSAPVNFGWEGNAMHVAESGVFGTSLADVYQSPLHKVLLYQTKKIIESESTKPNT